MKRSFVEGTLFLFVVFAFVVACEAAEPVANQESGAEKVATYEGGEITQSEVQEQVDLLAQQTGAGEIPPDSPQYDAVLQQVMPQVVALEMVRTYADENDITVSEEELDRAVEEQLEQIKDQFAEQAPQGMGREEAFEQALQQAGFTEEQLKDGLREQILDGLLLRKVQKRVVGNVEPSQEEVEEYYEKNKESQFTEPEQRCVRHILFSKDQKEKAEEVRDQLEDGGDFAELARENSQDPGSAEAGGDLGCAPEVDPQTGQPIYLLGFTDAVWSAEEGEIVGPVETEAGYHLIEVTDVQEKREIPLSEVEGGIRRQLSREQAVKNFEDWIEEQMKQRDIEYISNEYKPPATAPSLAPQG